MDNDRDKVTQSGGLPMREGAAVAPTPEDRAREGRFHEGGAFGVSLHRHDRGLRITMPDQRVDGVPTTLLSTEQVRELVDSLKAWLDQQDETTGPRHRT